MNTPVPAPEPGRRSGSGDRRKIADRRSVSTGDGGIRHATWSEQKTQYITRYLFLLLGLLFFNLAPGLQPTWMSLTQVNVVFVLLGLVITANFWHASRNLFCVPRYRFAMWADIVAVSLCVSNDPYEIPPSLIVFILVALGNGMRYGMRFFAEAVAGSFLGGCIALAVRQVYGDLPIPTGMIFLAVFAAIVLVYAYMLMGRIENSRSQLERTSNTDTLTGLLNRRALLAAADGMFDRVNRHDGRLVLLFADMDRFKSVNDGRGHAMGDQVLKTLGCILHDSIRSGDIAARYGGDEFVVLLNDASIDEGEQIARRIQARVQAFALEQGLDFGVTIALGEAPTHGATIDTLMDRVDEALYRCKAQRSEGGIGRAVAQVRR
jgi:diguanylate cyclase (GGDEF)-like protein